MKKILKPLIITLSILLVIVPIIILVATKPFKNTKNNRTTTIDTTDINSLIPVELPGGVSKEVASKVYASVAVELMSSGYDVFNAVKITSDGSEYGLGYTDFNTSYTSDEYSKTFLSSGFISFANEDNVVKNDDLTFINEIDENGNEIYDEKYSFVYSFDESNIKKGHFIYNHKYVKYEVVNGLLKIEELECKKENYDLTRGRIYNYDISDYDFIPYDEIDSSPDDAIPLIQHLDSDKIKEELENVIKTQNENGYKIEGIYISYISNDVLEAYNKQYTQLNTLNGYSFDDLDKIEYDNETQYLCFGSDGDIYIRELPPIPASDTKKGLWDFVVDGLVLVGAGAVAVVGVVASPYTGGASLVLTGAAIGAGVQYFSETIIEGKKFNEVNWTKVAIMSVSGAIGAAIPCAGVAGYFVAGVVGGLTSGIMTALDGGSSQEILLSSVKGATISVLTHGLFASCFPKGTKVLTNNGLINIENIKKGMYVLSYNELLGITEYKEVLETYINSGTYFTDITFGNGETITSTYNHPYYVPKTGKYIKAQYLEKGMEVLDCDGNFIRIIDIKNYYDNKEVYNFNVADNHNYYVGSTSILVHNSCGTLTTNPISVSSKSLGSMAKETGKVLISKPAIATYIGLLTVGGIAYTNNADAVNDLSYHTFSSIDTYTNIATETSSDTYSNGLRKKAKNTLSDLRNKGEDDYGWTEDELTNALEQSFNIVNNGMLTNVRDLSETKRRKGLRVYLGTNPKYFNMAVDAAKHADDICVFHFSDKLWSELVAKVKNRNTGINDEELYYSIWLLINKPFLEYVISLDCIFVLTETPYPYYHGGIKIKTYNRSLNEYIYTFYSRELEYIRMFPKYIWNDYAEAIVIVGDDAVYGN